MAINLQNRLEGAVDSNTRNYKSVVMYDLPGNMKMTLHLPVFDAKAIPFPIACAFKPKKDSLAIIYAGPHHTVCANKLNAAGAPIGNIVNSSMFVKK
eukprot:12870692-Ditylum_brightwellii.AAC.1